MVCLDAVRKVQVQSMCNVSGIGGNLRSVKASFLAGDFLFSKNAAPSVFYVRGLKRSRDHKKII